MGLPSEIPVVLELSGRVGLFPFWSESEVLEQSFEHHRKVRMLLLRCCLRFFCAVRSGVLPLAVPPTPKGLREFLALAEDPNRRQDDPNPFFVLYITKGLSASDGILESDLYGVSASFRLGIPHLPMPAGAHSGLPKP